MSASVPVFASGGSLRADDLNAIASAARGGSPSVGGGIAEVWCRVLAVLIDPGDAGDNGAYSPASVRYDIRPFGGASLTGITGDFTDRAPELGRPVRDDELLIYPAAVGDLCKVILVPPPPAGGSGVDGPAFAARLWILTETIAAGACDDVADGGGL